MKKILITMIFNDINEIRSAIQTDTDAIIVWNKTYSFDALLACLFRVCRYLHYNLSVLMRVK